MRNCFLYPQVFLSFSRLSHLLMDLTKKKPQQLIHEAFYVSELTKTLTL